MLSTSADSQHLNSITICITMGKRPDHLRQTLASLKPLLLELPIIGINDFGDAETSRVFDSMCPNGTRIDLGERVGHHLAVDAMYEAVKTPYIFHIEDDWGFTRTDFIDDAIKLLNLEPSISNVCVRNISDFTIDEKDLPLIKRENRGGVEFSRLDGLHKQWHGYTFNPHIARKSLWSELGKFSQFKKERHISRVLRGRGQFTAFLEPGACNHIGNDYSVAHARPTRFKRFKNWIRGRN